MPSRFEDDQRRRAYEGAQIGMNHTRALERLPGHRRLPMDTSRSIRYRATMNIQGHIRCLALLTVWFALSAAAPATQGELAQQNVHLSALEQRLERLESQADPRERELSEQDVIAQKLMALYADRMVWATWAQFMVGSIGAAAVIGALHFNRVTIRKTNEQLKEARRQLRLSQRQGMQQLRAYVSIGSFKIKRVEDRVWEVKVKVSNAGQTPARELRIWTTLTCPPDGAYVRPKRQAYNEGMIEPDRAYYPIRQISLTQRQIDAAARGSARIYATVEAEYRDVFRAKYIRRSVMIFSGTDFSRMNPMPSEVSEEELEGPDLTIGDTDATPVSHPAITRVLG